MDYLEVGTRCLLGSVFFISSLSKVAGSKAYRAFTASVRELRLLPSRLVGSAALLVVFTEFFVWGVLAVPHALAAFIGFTVAATALAVFAAAIFTAVHQGVRAPCRCFGTSSVPLGIRHAVRNVALAVVAVVGLAFVPASHPANGIGLALSVLGGLLLGVLIAMFDSIYELFQPIHGGTAGMARSLR